MLDLRGPLLVHFIRPYCMQARIFKDLKVADRKSLWGHHPVPASTVGVLAGAGQSKPNKVMPQRGTHALHVSETLLGFLVQQPMHRVRADIG